jgi:putative lipoic acid-binding regulatory protein
VQVVGKTTPEAPKEAFVADMVALLARVCEVDIQQDQVQVQERLKGKYVSMSVQVMVRAPEVISRAYEEIGKDSRVKMKF